jgi:hypothetical protein
MRATIVHVAMLNIIRRIICFCFGRFPSALCGKLSCHFQDWLAGKDLIDFSRPLSPDDPLEVDEEEISLRSRRIPLSVQAAIAPDYFEVRKIT